MTSPTPRDHPVLSKAHPSNRPKVPKDARKRIAIACERCKGRRIRCSGDTPCNGCREADIDCVYPREEKRVFVPLNYILELEEKNSDLEREINSLKLQLSYAQGPPGGLSVLPNISQQRQSRVGLHHHSTSFDSFANQITNILIDPSGHARYIGDSAGAAYIDRIRAFVKTSLYEGADFTLHLSYYHTWDSRPIQFVPRDPYGLPSREKANSLIEALFVTYPLELYYLVHPAVLTQHLDSVYEDPGHNHSVLALVNAALALGAQASGIPDTTEESSPGMEYFARVKLLLATVWEDNNIMSIQTLNILALFLIGANRRDAAYSYIGIALRIALAHGLHRRSATHTSEYDYSSELIQNNIRIWWTTYIIERTVEILMGRPSQIHDEDIDTEPPAEMSGFPQSHGLHAHSSLACVMGQIISNVFRTRGREDDEVKKSIMELHNWRDNLPPHLRLIEGEWRTLPKDVLLLNLIYNQMLLVTLRMPVLEYLISQSGEVFNPQPSTPHSTAFPYLNITLQAARENLLLSQSLRVYSPYTFYSFHYIFSAAISLVVQSFLANETTSSDEVLISEAIDNLKELGKRNESAESCAKMVRDLSVVVANVQLVRNGLRTVSDFVFSPREE